MKLLINIFLVGTILTHHSLLQAAELGRLFFSPDQRTRLDYTLKQDANTSAMDRDVVLNGIVQKNGGKRIAWINGVAREAGNSDESSPESMPITLPGKQRQIKVKVGQKISAPLPGINQ